MSAAKKTWLELATEAIVALKERTGSSQPAIKAWISSNYPAVEFAAVSYPYTPSFALSFLT
jgi:hypothetical protein